MKLDSVSPPNETWNNIVRQGLYTHNREQVGSRHFEELSVILRNDDEEVVGGVLGGSIWGWMIIETFWVDKTVRGQGYGRQLLLHAEEIARQRACTDIILETFSFQALPFYKKLGYTVYGQLDGFPAGHTRYSLRKRLGEEAPTLAEKTAAPDWQALHTLQTHKTATDESYADILHQIMLDLLQRQDLDELLVRIVDHAAVLLDAPYGEIMLLDGDELVVRAYTSNQDFLVGDRVRRGEALVTWRAFDTHQPALVDDYFSWSGRRVLYEGAQLAAVADFPIMHGEQCIGVLAMARTVPNYPFNAENVRRGMQFSQLVALVLDNVRLHTTAAQELAERKEVERTLNQLYQVMATPHDTIAEQLTNALKVGTELLGLPLSIISQIEGDDYVVLHTYTAEGLLQPGQHFPFQQTVCEITYQTNDLVTIEHMGESIYNTHPCYAAFGLESYVGIPLYVEGRRFGTLNFSSPAVRPTPFTKAEKEFLLLMGQWVSTELEKQFSADNLRQSEEQFRTLVSNIPGITYRCLADENWTMLFMSEATLEVTGYPAADFLYNNVRSFNEIIHPDDRDLVNQIVLSGIQNETSYNFDIEYRIIHASGEVHWVREKGRGIYDEQDNLRFLDGAIFDITKRKQTEDQQRATLAAIPDLMFRLDKSGRFLDYHAPDQDKLMLNPDDFIGRHLAEVLPAAVAEQLTQALQQVYTTDHPAQFEYQLRLPTGLAEFEGRVVAINDAEALALVRDITASKEAERTRQSLLEELTQLTTQQKIILDNAPAAIFMQKERTIIWGNRATEQVLGYTAEEMRHLPNVTYHISPETYAEFGRRTIPTQERGEISHTEIQVRRKDGAVRWVYVTGQAINPQRVREDGVLWIMQDVTELKEAQLALQQTADRLAEAQALGRMSNWELDMITGEVLWAKEHYALFGVSPDTFAPTPSNFRVCIHPDDIDIIDQSRDDVRDGKPYNLEYRIIRPNDGQVRHMHSWAKRITNNQGELIRLVGVVQDVTERKEIEATIRAYANDLAIARDQALAASKYKSLLLSKVSHELRTPLGGILGYAELLRDGLVGQLQPEQQRFIMQIVRSSQHLNGLIADLLDQAQIEQGSLKVIEAPFILAPMVNFLEGLLQPLAAEKGLAFAINTAPTLPETIIGDERRIRQIIINLTNNAIKFTETGGVQVHFQPAAEQGWVIQVQDTGQGISPESQSKIFDSFWQEDGSAVSAQKGYGLGLSIVHHLVQLMAGRIEIESELGRGSTFTVWLPFKAF